MYFRLEIFLFMLMPLLFSACSPYRKIRQIQSGSVGIMISVPQEEASEREESTDVIVDSIRGTLTDEPLIMNAVRDSETGEMVATDVINASMVTARFRNVAERAGYVSIGFDVTVPTAMSDSKWQLKIRPMMKIEEDTVMLEPIFITGREYREAQLKGYQRYQAFLASIITDTTDFIRIHQLEIFLRRYFPDTYAMKTDSTYISEPMAENIFGVTQSEALRHYTRHLKRELNERRKGRIGRMYEKYVRDPIIREGIRLDTVLTSVSGDFVYRYTHTFRCRPGLKKVMVSLSGSLYEKGECIMVMPFPDELVFYISSLSTLADDTPKYRMIVLERQVSDNTKAFIDFSLGSSEVDTLLGDNSSELRRVRRCIENVSSRKEYVFDSLVIVASCSPEGSYALNKRLSAARSEAVRRYIGHFVPEQWRDSLKASELPENWEQLQRRVANDTLLDPLARKEILSIIAEIDDPDMAERRLACLPQYRYLREKLYPELRSVSFDFYLHRIGMVKDTVHTTELDSLYMSGVEALKALDYKKAVAILRPYADYNSALALISADYNHSALAVLERLDDSDARVCYLKAMAWSRLGQSEKAMKYYDMALSCDPYMEYRANLDPEMHELVRLKGRGNP